MMIKEYEVGYALHRSRMDIMENILRVTNEGARKTHIMYRCNLSFEQLHTYLDLLASMGLLKSVPPRTGERSNSNMYETTEKGQAFIQVYRNLTDLFAV
jgi:predicted transcriptional regulator